MQQSGTLYIVATPIGNLDDASSRMRQVLAAVDCIACEDTRHSGRLLTHLGIRKPLVSLHEHNEAERVPGLIAALASGENVALVSDAGTPLLSDPGFPLVRSAVASGIPVCPVPGPNAAIAALSASGIAPEPFRFLGFPPRQPGARRRYFESLAEVEDTLIFYESIHRLAATLADLCQTLGAERSACVGRELTKRHEQLRHGDLAELADWAAHAPEARKGEAVIVVAGAPANDPDEVLQGEGARAINTDALLRALSEALAPRKAAQVAAKATGLPKNALYQRLLALKGDDST
ncbi:16S rRNA (cytidine(1402)-2'-O)-methyltransferase [Natronospira bacteriovora]|uniref:Ribosomal RNA small subunit methyltransferase I n=1 Tax=Natronospira bacteriovora TaxID=3069753 RepID=A0ABU0W688_9GAMM|nr:16S rRNA (cytidine(1402)-2'-O)-methyltransferase [Natronospira sp. AB-CW4]MDQ2069516.1 16S rRNA (cytidine(1402)-2'-O)-methyltransferase [Natronospira sp. AB-CW4]